MANFKCVVARCLLPMPVLVFVLLAGACDCWAEHPAVASEAELKAAFVYNFAKFVDWPEEFFEESKGEVLLCVAGVSVKTAEAFLALDGNPVKGRRLRVSRDISPDGITDCSILYMGQSAGKLADAVRSRMGLLTVSDTPGFTASGGVIELFKTDGRMRFEINTDAAKTAGLVISSRLLQLARISRARPTR